MNKNRFLAMVLGSAFCVLGMGIASAQKAPAATGVPAHLVVTVEARKGSEVPVINRDDVMVYEGHDRDTVTDWVPAQGEHAALELFLLLDDASSVNLGSQLGDLRQFINAQPDSTKIGVAYMQNGIARIEQNLTSDHALAAKALRLPMGMGGANASPYFSLSDLVKRWPATTARRSIMMVTDGIDRHYGSWDLLDPYRTRRLTMRCASASLFRRFTTPMLATLATATGGAIGARCISRTWQTQPEAKPITSGLTAQRWRLLHIWRT